MDDLYCAWEIETACGGRCTFLGFMAETRLAEAGWAELGGDEPLNRFTRLISAYGWMKTQREHRDVVECNMSKQFL